MRVAVCQNQRLLCEGLTRTLRPMTAEPSNVQINDRPATSNWQVTETTCVAAMNGIGVVATIWADASHRTDRCTISPHSDTCSSTSPAPGGNNTCGPTVHPLGGPAIRQAGAVTGTGTGRARLRTNLDIDANPASAAHPPQRYMAYDTGSLGGANSLSSSARRCISSKVIGSTTVRTIQW